MDYNKIKESLIKNNSKVCEIIITNFINYLKFLETQKNSRKELSNPWFKYRNENYFIDCFNKVHNLGLCLDGDIVTINSNGISLSYNAYKNLVLLRYPETKFDVQLVRENDEFSFAKKNGAVFYTHKLTNPFNEEKIIGAYCIIKNKMGEFIEPISIQELEKIRKTAKTDYIWKMWLSEMYLKTIIKRACKRHFKDVIIEADKLDNEVNYDIENPLDIELKTKQEIEAINTLSDLSGYYHKNKDKVELKKSFNKLIAKRKEELSNDNS